MRERRPFIVKRSDGEYSTVELPDGSIETCWFPNDQNKPSQVIGRTYLGLASVAEDHISNWEGNN